jgi:hypothetical protein
LDGAGNFANDVCGRVPVCEAGADLGGMAAALNLFVPVPIPWLVVAIAIVILALQLYGSYILIRNVFRWLALVLLAYVAAAVLAKPDLGEVLRGTVLLARLGRRRGRCFWIRRHFLWSHKVIVRPKQAFR